MKRCTLGFVRFFLAVAAVACLILAGCAKQGKAESAGEKIDEAVGDVKEGAKEAGNDIERAVEDATD